MGSKHVQPMSLLQTRLQAVVKFLSNVLDCCHNHTNFGGCVLQTIFILVSTQNSYGEILWIHTI